MSKIIRLNEIEMSSLVKKVISKLKGVSEKQINYNIEHDLPWDWKGSKEGYLEKLEPRKNHSGSN